MATAQRSNDSETSREIWGRQAPSARSFDAAIVVVERTHKRLEHWEADGRKGDHRRVIIDAPKEVSGPAL
jgi:hypothetical protein